MSIEIINSADATDEEKESESNLEAMLEPMAMPTKIQKYSQPACCSAKAEIKRGKKKGELTIVGKQPKAPLKNSTNSLKDTNLCCRSIKHVHYSFFNG